MFKKVVIFFLFIICLYIFNAFLNPFPKRVVPAGFRPNYGTSFSFEQAAWYGQDSRASFERLISEHKFDWIRVPFFWDQMTDSGGNLKIDDLKFAAETARVHNTKLIIALGTKTPYFPEYHFPKSVEEKLSYGQTINLNSPVAADILAIDKKVVIELSGYKSIYAWQVENEALLANVNGWKISPDLLAAEVKAVRENDPLRRPIILNSAGSSVFGSNVKSLIGLLKPGDILGVNAFFKTQGTYLVSKAVLGKEIRVPWPKWLVWPVQSWPFISPDFTEVKKDAESKGLEVWIMEAQAEPYVRDLNYAKQADFSFKSSDIELAVNYLASYRIKSIGLWGANFWQFRESLGDKSWTAAVSRVVD